MSIGLVWAQSIDGVIGNAGAIPWRVPEDLAHFRSVTGAGTVVMGRRTWDSLPQRFRPLPGRRNVVVTRQSSFSADGAVVVHSIEEAVTASADQQVWVIGGGELYSETIDSADTLEVTEIDLAMSGDTTAPEITNAWRLRGAEPQSGWYTSSTGTRYRFRSYERTTPRPPALR